MEWRAARHRKVKPVKVWLAALCQACDHQCRTLMLTPLAGLPTARRHGQEAFPPLLGRHQVHRLLCGAQTFACHAYKSVCRWSDWTNVSWWEAQGFLLGSIVWCVNGSFAMFPLTDSTGASVVWSRPRCVSAALTLSCLQVLGRCTP